jgi:electron transfer flavoprotein beta subunit
MGADSAVHVVDDAIHGSDALATSLVLAEAVSRTGFDLVLTGMGSTDAEMSVVPAMLAHRLDVAQATFAGDLAVRGDSVVIGRDVEGAHEQVTTGLPAVVSVTDRTGEARYPAFRSIMLAKKKPVTTWSLADLGLDPARVGLEASASRVVSVTPAPARAAGTVVTDDGTGAAQLAGFLDSRGLL